MKRRMWHLKWCGHDIKGSPFRTRRLAEATLRALVAAREHARQPAYGSYTIEPSSQIADRSGQP